jgi:pimeloyl-ACP methyl ester carboxylesterase
LGGYVWFYHTYKHVSGNIEWYRDKDLTSVANYSNFESTTKSIAMKSLMLFFVLLTLAFISISKVASGQDTCNYSLKYGNNSDASKYVYINGIQMYYETYGDISKQPLLIIHGNGGSIFSGRCQIENFKDKYYIIAPDSRYHGKTENGSETLTYDLLTEDYYELLNLLKIDSVFIIGQSDGAIIGLLLAMNYPQKVKKLAAAGPNIKSDSTAFYNWALDLIDLTLASFDIDDTSASSDRQKSQINLMDKYPNIDSKELLKIQAQVLIMAGDEDAIKLEHIIDIYHHIPKAQLFIMPGATHFMLREEYALFNQIVELFFSSPFKRPTTKEHYIK